MTDINLNKIEQLAYKYALQNAYDHGQAKPNISGKIIADYPDCKNDMKNTMQIVIQIIDKVNKMNKDKIESEMKQFEYQSKTKPEREGLPELEFAKDIEIVTRIAPNPSGLLHLGHAKQIILCDEYAKMYKGRFIVRLEDTDPKTKKPMLEAYDQIPKDIEWLECNIDQVIKQSDRIEKYYKYAEELIKMDKAYVCTCPVEIMRKNREEGIACKCRAQTIEQNLEQWENMKTEYNEGDAILRIKTDIKHANSSLRDWPAFRIITEPHPLTKNKYRVWPLYNFSCAIDDHLLGVTFVIRGKEHELNALKQKYIYEYFNWKPPEFRESGIVKLSNKFAHKSDIRKAINNGEINGWLDIQLPTLYAMKKRGIQPKAIRQYMIHVGLRPTDSKLDWNILKKYNDQILKDIAKQRLTFIKEPVELNIDDNTYYMEKDDYEKYQSKEVRLKDRMNIILSSSPEKTADKKSKDIPTIIWIEKSDAVNATLNTVNGKVYNGRINNNKLSDHEIVYFDKLGYAKLDDKKDMSFILTYDPEQ